MGSRRERSPSELLATVLLADLEGAALAVRETGERSLWENAIGLAGSWRVVPALARRLSDLGERLQTEIAARLERDLRRAAIQATLTCRRAAEALAVLGRAGVPALAFKGVATIGHLHRRPARRMLQDADLLVGRGDVVRAVEALCEIGFERELAVDLNVWLALLDDRVYRDHEYVELRDGDGAAVDLHWELPFAGKGGFGVEDLLQRRCEVPFSHTTLSLPSPEDALLLTVHHAVRDRLVPRAAIKDLLDASDWFGSGVVDGEVLTRRAAQAGLSAPVAALAMILADFDAHSPAGEWLAASGGGRRQAERLLGFFRLQLREGEVAKSVLGLSAMSLPMIGRFAVSRWKSLRNPEYRAIFHHHDIASRPRDKRRGLVRDLLRLGPARLRLVRAMARETRKLA